MNADQKAINRVMETLDITPLQIASAAASVIIDDVQRMIDDHSGHGHNETFDSAGFIKEFNELKDQVRSSLNDVWGEEL